MSVWREVQESLYARFVTIWADATPYVFGNEKIDPPAAPWCRFSVQSAPSEQETLGSTGNRKFARTGRVYGQIFEPPGDGVGRSSDLAERFRPMFEGCTFAPHAVRFNALDIGPGLEIEGGRWWMIVAEAGFAYDELR